MRNYDVDFYAWTQEQAALLRAGKLSELDTANLLEEIEAMGRSERAALRSNLIRLFQHLLKWRYQPSHCGKSWRLTIKEQRRRIADNLGDNPSLNHVMPELALAAYKTARKVAADETDLPLVTFPEDNPWTIEQALEENYFPGEHHA
ncbi:DUF29 domain-containing protein [Salmonella enterica]|nr:DUF29 domain-containing protein [Salmonella enterica]